MARKPTRMPTKRGTATAASADLNGHGHSETQVAGAPSAPSKGTPTTRLQILDATVEDFVREAGVARGTFYIYFTDKYDLLKALTALTTERIFEEAHVPL